MFKTYQLYCRACNVPMKVVSEETYDAECSTCGIAVQGDIASAFMKREIERRKFEAKAEAVSLKIGKPVKARLRPDDILDDLEKRVFVLKVPN